MNTKHIRLYTVLLLLGAAGGTYYWHSSGSLNNTDRAENVVVSHPSRLPGSAVDLSTNIFVGKVIQQSGTVSRTSLPETQFTVRVISSIKGKLEKIVTVNQSDTGYKDRKLLVIQGDTSIAAEANDVTAIAEKFLLQPGSTYVFATRYSKSYDWYTVLSQEGFTLITADAELTDEELRELAEDYELVRKWKEAVE
jgi:hypothetical protein